VRVAFTFNVQQHAKLIAGAAEFATPAAPERFTPGQSEALAGLGRRRDAVTGAIDDGALRRGREVAAP
jgi:hypothetical protein